MHLPFPLSYNIGTDADLSQRTSISLLRFKPVTFYKQSSSTWFIRKPPWWKKAIFIPLSHALFTSTRIYRVLLSKIEMKASNNVIVAVPETILFFSKTLIIIQNFFIFVLFEFVSLLLYFAPLKKYFKKIRSFTEWYMEIKKKIINLQTNINNWIKKCRNRFYFKYRKRIISEIFLHFNY